MNVAGAPAHVRLGLLANATAGELYKSNEVSQTADSRGGAAARVWPKADVACFSRRKAGICCEADGSDRTLGFDPAAGFRKPPAAGVFGAIWLDSAVTGLALSAGW